jgi:hypothetical protein
MNGQQASFVVAVSLVASVPVFADDLKPPTATPRELAHCMMKRLRANAAESYRGAFKACREQLDSARSDRSDTAMTAAALTEKPKR